MKIQIFSFFKSLVHFYINAALPTPREDNSQFQYKIWLFYSTEYTVVKVLLMVINFKKSLKITHFQYFKSYFWGENEEIIPPVDNAALTLRYFPFFSLTLKTCGTMEVRTEQRT